MAVASMVGCSFCLDLTFTGPLHHCTSAEAREQELCHRREEKPGRGVKRGRTVPAPPSTTPTNRARNPRGMPGNGAECVLTRSHHARRLPAQTARWSTITQIYEGTNQIQRLVMARQLLGRS
jgi:hypothetical protein